MKTDADTCPYVGLRPFSKDDRQYFFGREREQRVIFSSLSASPLTVLYGPSGTGKSSVLQAGLIPMVRLYSRRTGIVYYNRWQTASFLDDLKAQCVAEGKLVARDKAFTIDTALPLDEMLSQLRPQLSRPLLIVLDQFEEYLLYYPETVAERPFEPQLARAVALGESGASFLLALREDSLSRLDRFRTRIPNLLGNTLRLDALNRQGAEEALRKPLEVYREQHGDSAGPIKIEDALVTEVLDQVCRVDAAQLVSSGGESAAATTSKRGDHIEAAILQLVMKRLWNEERKTASSSLRLQTLTDLGGAARIVETYFAGVMEDLSQPEADTAAALFRFLVRPSGEKIAYSPGDLAANAERPLPEVNAVLKKLVAGSILRKTEAPERYELLHDILGPAMIGWRNHRVQTEKLARELGQREAQLAAERKSLAMKIAITAAVVFLSLAVFAVWQSVRASRAAARTERDLAQLVAAKFQEASVKSDPKSGKDLLFLIEARNILEANLEGELKKTQLEDIDARLAEALNSWVLPPTAQYAFVSSAGPERDFVTVDQGFFTWWNIAKREEGETEFFPEGENPIQAMSRDGRRVALGTFRGPLVIDLFTHQAIALGQGQSTKKLGASLQVVALSDVDDRLAVRRGAGVELWKNPTDPSPKSLGMVKAKGLLFRANTNQIVAMEDDVLKVKEVEDFKGRSKALREFTSRSGITEFALSSDGNLIAFADKSGAITLSYLDSAAEKERTLSTVVEDWQVLAFDPDRKRLAGFASDGQLFVWNLLTGEPERQITLRTNGEAVFSPDLHWIATSSANAITIHAVKPLSLVDILGEAKKKSASAQLEFEDILNAYPSIEFRLGEQAARVKFDAVEAARHFREGLALIREVHSTLSYDAQKEANRLTAQAFFNRAEKEARAGDYDKAKHDYDLGLALNRDGANKEFAEQIRQWSREALLRRADVGAAEGRLEAALKDLRDARALGAEPDPGVEARYAANVAELRVNEARRKLDSGGSQAEVVALLNEAIKLNPALAASLNPQREIEKAQARDLLRKASASLKENKFIEAIRQYADAQQLAGPVAEQEFAESTALTRAGYDTLTGALEVEFRSGKSYRYAGVPPETFDGLLRAESKGRFFSEQVRGKYSAERLQRQLLAPVPFGDHAAIGGFVGQLLKAADKAVTLAPENPALRQIRGVARALAGDLPGAADDLIAFANDPSHAATDVGRQNKTWAEQLRQGKNPFTPEVLKKLPNL